jgi:hypothetical protein
MRTPWKTLGCISAVVLGLSRLASYVDAAVDATEPPDQKPWLCVDLPSQQRERMRNPDGSCVQCSVAMCGVACNVPAAENLLWDSEFGPKVRGGSSPQRVKAYCDARQIPAWNISGPASIDWVQWALTTGRPCAITWGTNHMIAAVGYSGETLTAASMIAVCDNNSPQRVDWIPYKTFLAKHQTLMGGWVVVLQTPTPAGLAAYCEWWIEEEN